MLRWGGSFGRCAQPVTVLATAPSWYPGLPSASFEPGDDPLHPRPGAARALSGAPAGAPGEPADPGRLRAGRALPDGCGSFPYFLSHTSFRSTPSISYRRPLRARRAARRSACSTLDLNAEPRLPFADGHFSAVTLLAVVEHLDPGSLVKPLREVYRVLASDGRVVITTPAPWSDGLLRAMARLRLVSAEEIEEHVYAYTQALLGWYFGKADFPMLEEDP